MATSDIINSIKTNLTNAYTKLNDKGATIPANKNIENLASTIETVTAGGSTTLQTKSITITENGTQSVIPDEGYDGLEKVDITTNVPSSGGDISEYWDTTLSSDTYVGGVSSWVNMLKKLPDNITISGTNGNNLFYGIPFAEIPMVNTSNLTITSNMFYQAKKIITIPLLDTSNVTNMTNMFYSCSSLKTIPLINTSKVTEMGSMFNNCTSLESVPTLNTANVRNMGSMFFQCNKLKTIPLLDTSNVTDMNQMFIRCTGLLEIPALDTSKVTNMREMFNSCNVLVNAPQFNTENLTNMAYMFTYCSKLKTIPEFNCHKVTSISSAFNGCTALTTLGGFLNFGEALPTTTAANNGNWQITLTQSTKLTHDSLMNVINKLYDIATKGCKTQRLNIGATNMAKLTEEEVAVATGKGWTVL